MRRPALRRRPRRPRRCLGPEGWCRARSPPLRPTTHPHRCRGPGDRSARPPPGGRRGHPRRCPAAPRHPSQTEDPCRHEAPRRHRARPVVAVRVEGVCDELISFLAVAQAISVAVVARRVRADGPPLLSVVKPVAIGVGQRLVQAEPFFFQVGPSIAVLVPKLVVAVAAVVQAVQQLTSSGCIVASSSRSPSRSDVWGEASSASDGCSASPHPPPSSSA